MLSVARWVVVAASVTMIATGCQADSTESGSTFSASDLLRVASVAPNTPGWGFPRDRTSSRSFTRDTLGQSDGNEIQATLSGQLEKAGFVEGTESTWHVKIKASSGVMLFDTASGAHRVMGALREFSRRWQSEVEHEDVTDTPVTALGEEAWGIQQQDHDGSGEPDSVTYDWRRDNLILEVHIHCGGPCPSDIYAAARAWANDIDAETQKSR